MDNETIAKKKSVRKTRAPVAIDGPHMNKKPLLKQGTTWAGLFSIAAAIATGGTSVLLDPVLLTQIGAGISLIVAEN